MVEKHTRFEPLVSYKWFLIEKYGCMELKFSTPTPELELNYFELELNWTLNVKPELEFWLQLNF